MNMHVNCTGQPCTTAFLSLQYDTLIYTGRPRYKASTHASHVLYHLATCTHTHTTMSCILHNYGYNNNYMYLHWKSFSWKCPCVIIGPTGVGLVTALNKPLIRERYLQHKQTRRRRFVWDRMRCGAYRVTLCLLLPGSYKHQ